MQRVLFVPNGTFHKRGDVEAGENVGIDYIQACDQ